MKWTQNNRYAIQLGPVELLSRQGSGITARITCNQCSAHDEWNLARPPEPNILKRHFIVRGWDIGKKAICPQCKAKKKVSKAMAKPTPPINYGEPIVEPAAMVSARAQKPQRAAAANPSEASEASDAAKKAKRMIYMALEDYYDEVKKAYRNGHSDKSIAKEVGSSEAFVRSIRESDFGPIDQFCPTAELGAIWGNILDFSQWVGEEISQIEKSLLENKLSQDAYFKAASQKIGLLKRELSNQHPSFLKAITRLEKLQVHFASQEIGEQSNG